VTAWKSCADTAAFPHAAARFDTCFMLCSFNYSAVQRRCLARYCDDDNPSTALLFE
jgi:hypothetical protein